MSKRNAVACNLIMVGLVIMSTAYVLAQPPERESSGQTAVELERRVTFLEGAMQASASNDAAYTTAVDRMAATYEAAVNRINMTITMFMAALAILSVILAILGFRVVKHAVSDIVEKKVAADAKDRAEEIFRNMSEELLAEAKAQFEEYSAKIDQAYKELLAYTEAAKKGAKR